VHYAYEVAGQEHEGQRWSFLGSAPQDFEATAVEVHYDPLDPSRAVLDERAPGWGDLLNVGVISALIGALVVIAVPFWLEWALRDPSPEEPSSPPPPTGI